MPLTSSPARRDTIPSDAGPSDAGPSDAGPSDAGHTDTGPAASGTTPRSGGLRRLAALLAAPLLLSVVIQNAANVGFHAVVGRVLPPGDYGALGAVLAVMVLLSVPLTALQAAASAQVSAAGWDRGAVRTTLRRSAVGALVAGLVVAAAAPTIQGFFHLATLAEAAVLAPFVAVSVLLAVVRGLLLGAGAIGTVAGTYIWGTAARLAAGLGLLVPFGVAGALVGTLLGEVVALATALVPALRRDGHTDVTAALGLRAVGLTAVAVTGLFLFSTSDLLLARHFLAEAETGAYVAAATIAKTVLALPAAAMSVYYPRLVAAWGTASRAGALRTALAVVGGLAVLAGTAIALLPGLLLTVLYGPDGFADSTGLVRTLGIVAAMTGLVSVFTYAALARRSASLLIPWAGAVLEIGLIAWRHGSAAEVAQGSVLALVPTLLLLAAVESRAWLRRVPVTGPTAAPATTGA